MGKKFSNDIIPLFNNIKPKNENQSQLINLIEDNSKSFVFAVGPSGVGKTIIATHKGIELFNKKIYNKIIITRPTVGADEDLGFLPGNIEEKMDPWMYPIISIFKEYFSKDNIEYLLKTEKLIVFPLMYMRGTTFKNSYIIADELQNSTPNQMKLLLTRLGNYSKIIVTGDIKQHDLKITNGLTDFINRYKENPSKHIGMVNFTKNDVVRHPAIKDILNMYGED